MAVIKVYTLAIPLLGISPSAHLNTTPPPPTPCVRPTEALNAQMGKPRHREDLLSSPLLSPYVPSKKEKCKKMTTSTSSRPRLSEEGEPSTAALPGDPLQGLGPARAR